MLKDRLHGRIQLGISPFTPILWHPLDLDVGGNAIVLDIPRPRRIVRGSSRDGDAAAVDQFGHERVRANPRTHRSRADDPADPTQLEHQREGLGGRAVHIVDQQHIRVGHRVSRDGDVLSVAERVVVERPAAERLDQEVRCDAAVREPLVDHKPLDAGFGQHAAQKFLYPRPVVAHVDVRQLPLTLLVDSAPVALRPVGSPQCILAGERHHGVRAESSGSRVGTNGDPDRSERLSLEVGVDVAAGQDRLAIDFQKVLPFGDIYARLVQGRLKQRIGRVVVPRAVDPRDSIAPVADLVIRSE